MDIPIKPRSAHGREISQVARGMRCAGKKIQGILETKEHYYIVRKIQCGERFSPCGI